MDELKSDKNHRPIACESCISNGNEPPTMLQAWANDALLEAEDVDSIDFLPDDEIRRLATQTNDCGIEGHCYACNGPDDDTAGDED